MLALLRGRGQRLRLRMAAQMERLPDRLQRSEPWMVDRFGDAEMAHLRIGKGLFDRIDRAARHSGLVQYFDPVGVRLLPNDLRQMRVERGAVAKSGSSASSRAPAASQKRRHRLSPEAAMLM